MDLKQVSQLIINGNQEAFKQNAKRRAGKMFNERAVALIKPKLPLMVRGYAEEPIGEFVIANIIAAAIIKFGYTNEKLILLADAGIEAASDDLLGSFNIEAMVNELIDGIQLPNITLGE